MTFATLIKDIKSDASKIESEFKTLFNEAPTWAAIAGGTIVRIAPLVTTLVTLTLGAPAGSETATILAAIKAKLAAGSMIASTIDASTSLPSLLTNIQSTLPTLLSAIQVENPQLVSKVSGVVSQIAMELSALIQSVPVLISAAGSNAATTVALAEKL